MKYCINLLFLNKVSEQRPLAVCIIKLFSYRQEYRVLFVFILY